MKQRKHSPDSVATDGAHHSEAQSGASLPAEQRLRVAADDYRFAVAPDEIRDALELSATTSSAETAAGANGEFGIIGQPRAIRALRMALKIRNRGYNVIVTGPAGVGKRTAVERVLAEYADDTSGLRDIVYVHNFRCSYEPRVLYLSPGYGRRFRSAVADCVHQVKRGVELLGENREFTTKRDALLQSAQTREAQTIAAFEDKIGEAGFQVVDSPEDQGKAELAPVIDGEPASFADLERGVAAGRLDRAGLEKIRERYYRYLEEMHQIMQRLRMDRESIEKELDELRRVAIEPITNSLRTQLAESFPERRVTEFVEACLKDMLENLDLFLPHAPGTQPEQAERLERYGVNIVVDHTDSRSAPVIFESNPDYQTLFGSIESGVPGEEMVAPSYRSLRAGSVAKASGGYLVVRAEDLFTQEDVWQACKRVLQDGITEIRTVPGPQMHPGALRPEPIEVRFKLIVTAGEHVYDALYYGDEDFAKLFKVTAEFDSVMPRNRETTARYIAFQRMITQHEDLLDMHEDGYAAVLEHSARLSEFRGMYSTRFSRIADLLREADYCARRGEQTRITREAVEAAVSERAYLSNLPEEKIDEQILSGELLVAVSGRAVGRINALAVLDRGYYAFARPMLITARTAPGSEGIVNIERESGLSGEIHDKGVYILEGYLRSKYAQDFPLSVRGSICFEQSYIEVDGDSASSSEVYVLLSSIAELPLRQDIAVTGSVNQMGQIQAVGGINEKIEGFYEVCCKLGLSGTQGVIIPRGNVANLMPSQRLQEALDADRFHIWAVSSVDEAMEILTGLEAGTRTGRGSFHGGTVNAYVERRLREMALQMKSFGAL